jgi:phosphatidylcholine synthase
MTAGLGEAATRQEMQPVRPSEDRIGLRAVAGFAVHIFTACGGACALLALFAATAARWTEMFFWLGLALIIDGVDGTFARRLRVGELLPRWSGELLDFVVDFATYVFVPAYALAAGDVLPQAVGPTLGVIVAVSGALYFADRKMKTGDGYFRGFPVLWNIVAFYLFLLRPPPWLAAVAVIALSAATFAPLYFVHPLRASRWHRLNLIMLASWAVLASWALAQDLKPPGWVAAALVAIAVYFVAVGLSRRVD